MESNLRHVAANTHRGDPVSDSTLNSTSLQTFEALLRGDAVEQDDAQALARCFHKPYALVAVQPHHAAIQADAHEAAATQKLLGAQAVIACDGNFEFALMANADARRLADNPAKAGADGKVAGISLPFYSMEDVARQKKLLQFGLDRCEGERFVDAKDAALPYLKEEILEHVSTEGLLHPALAKLARYDESNQSSLLETLKVYLMYDRNAQRCANTLYLHRNSLQYRVRRIQEIADIDLEDPVERAYLRLSFFLGSD